jgi:hypothetical protein
MSGASKNEDVCSFAHGETVTAARGRNRRRFSEENDMKTGTRILLAVVSLSLVMLIGFAAYGRRKEAVDDRTGKTETQWEYLVISGGSVNLSTSGNESYPSMRKETDGSFNREYFPLERNFDKLGAKGWELVSVHGSTNDPVYFFKRLKEGR